MEELLRELIAVNREMLNEIKDIRRALESAGESAQPERTGQAEARGQSADFRPSFAQGQEVSEPSRTPPPRYSPEDLEDIRGSLMDGLKKRNKDKSNAFTEFEKRHKDW